jgi:hypothetical protein
MLYEFERGLYGIDLIETYQSALLQDTLGWLVSIEADWVLGKSEPNRTHSVFGAVVLVESVGCGEIRWVREARFFCCGAVVAGLVALLRVLRLPRLWCPRLRAVMDRLLKQLLTGSLCMRGWQSPVPRVRGGSGLSGLGCFGSEIFRGVVNATWPMQDTCGTRSRHCMWKSSSLGKCNGYLNALRMSVGRTDAVVFRCVGGCFGSEEGERAPGGEDVGSNQAPVVTRR